MIGTATVSEVSDPVGVLGGPPRLWWSGHSGHRPAARCCRGWRNLRLATTLTPDQRQADLVEVSALGEKDLLVNRSDLRYSLVTLPGSFSPLELACLIEVGARQVLTMDDGGFAFEEEYQQAMMLITPEGTVCRTLNQLWLADQYQME